MFTALEYIFTALEPMFTARKHNFSRCKDTSFFRYHQIITKEKDECEKVKGQLSYIVQDMKEERQQSRSRGFHM